MRKKVKAILISLLCVAVALAILFGVLWYFRNQTDPVTVVPAMYYLGYFGDSMQYYDGLVTADNLQAVYPSDTQTVTEIFVTEGQTVHVGDALLSYDTTLSEIQLERKRIDVQQAELNLQTAKRELTEINAMKPYTPPPATEPPTEPPTEPLEPVEELPYFLGGDGSRENPYRWLWADGLTFDETFIRTELGDMSDEVWLAFEVREENALEGALLERWGLHVTTMYIEDGTRPLKYAFFEPEDAPSDDPSDDPGGDLPDDGFIDDSSGYTAAEIAQLRAEKQREIRDLDVKYRMAQIEYEQMQDEAENGVVYAKVDGEVIGLTDAETAGMEGRPILTVSGGGSFYVQVAIGEYDRESYPVGTEVHISSWMTGTELTGTVTAIADLPTSGYYYGEGNRDVSLYNATVAVAPDAGLREGEYVSVMFGAPESSGNTIYLDNMFIRTEDGGSYIYKRGDNGRLEKRRVTLGSSMWGYTAVLSGLHEDDYIAFPYGVKAGAETVEDSDGILDGTLY